MPPTRVDLDAYHGDTWTQTFRLKSGATPASATPVNLTGATVACWAQNGSAEPVPLTASVTNPTGGEVTIGGSLFPGSYEYDLEVTLAGVVTTWIRGQLSVEEDITNG